LSKTRISLLIELLKSFTDKEFTAFTKFVESEFKVYEDTFCDKPLKQKELTKKQYVFLNNKQHKLLRLAEQFLMIENLDTNETLKMELLYKPLIDRNQINLYKRHLKSDTKKLDNETKRGIGYYNKQYKLQEVILDYRTKNGQINKEYNFNKLLYYLDINYIIEKLNYYNGQLALKNLYGNKINEFLALDKISNLLEVPQYAENILIRIYLSNIDLVERQNDESYNNLLKTLANNQNNLPLRFLRIFYVNLTNYCTTQIRRGNTIYYRNLFDIYKIMHQQNLLMIDKIFNFRILKNIITVSCAVREFEWANEILEHYKKFLHSKFRQSVYDFNKGVIAFNEKKYKSAQDWFLKVNKINDTYETGLRIFMLQCIFEIEEDYNDATRQSFESTKQFFKRDIKLTQAVKMSYLNFITVFVELYKYKHKITKVKLSKIKLKIESMEFIRQKKWLYDKIQELE